LKQSSLGALAAVRKILRILGLALALVLAVGGFTFLGAYRASQHVPEFYERAIKVEPTVQAEAGHALERQVLDLHNEVRSEGRWQAVFTDEEINGWLAVDLPAKFPDALPPEVRDPRVAIDPQQAQIACRYDGGSAQAVISLALEIRLTDEPNVIAVRIRQARAGLLPLPIRQGLDKVSAAARAAGIPLRWSQKDGDPVALVTVPVEHKEYAHRLVRLETLELRAGEILLGGRTELDEPPQVESASAGEGS
jgi:hypothetical protein